MKTSLLPPPQLLVPTGQPGLLSDSIISATPGKFYAYQPVFTDQKPLYALLDCKANKSRTTAQASELGREVHLHFGFKGATPVRATSVKTAMATGLFAPVDAEFDDVWVAPAAGIAIEDFYTLCAKRDSAGLANICKAACSKRETSIIVTPGIIVAVMTSGGKYGLFMAKQITPTTASVDACHVLLP
jgi:hypothetical protein